MTQKIIQRLCLLILIAIVIASAGCDKAPKETGHDEHAPKMIRLAKEVQESAGLSLREVQEKKLASYLEVYGSIAQDTENTVHVTSKEEGILKTLKVSEGDTVEEGSALAVFQASTGLQEIHSPTHGIVLARYLKEGERVDTVTSILTIANPDVMRASFDVYEKDLGFVSLGQKVMVTSMAYRGKEFGGKVVFVSPRVDEATRTVKIRVDVQNGEDHLLKFGMFVTGKIARESEKGSLVIPAESLQIVEEQPVVFVKTGEEIFEVRHVRKGRETDEEIEILEGIQKGERIVANGSFILKSELMKSKLGGHHD